MPLIVPFVSTTDTTSINLVRLAEFMGIDCIRVPMESIFADTFPSEWKCENSCLALNSSALKAYREQSPLTDAIAHRLTSAFKYTLVHNLNPDPLCEEVVRVLSSNQFLSVCPTRIGSQYEVSRANEQITGPFSGLTFGFSNPAVDRMMKIGPESRSVSQLISVDNGALLAMARRSNAQLFFLATSAIADLKTEIRDREGADPLFSQLIPPALVLRHMFSAECWQPHERYATLTIDDPPLWPSYGYLNYERLLLAMDVHNFHSTIAFIPHNYRRDSPEVVQLFQTRPDRFSICFHGNDHTRAEFGDTNPVSLNNTLNTATARMEHHRAATSIKCDRVMVFPQGIFSQRAMDALRSHNFLAAVNTESRPPRSSIRIELRDFMQPALMNYGFPLFMRKAVNDYKPENLAFNLFFGKPLFIGAHHDLFKNMECLEELVNQINAMSPAVRWSNLHSAINNSYLTRRLADGTREIYSYGSIGTLENQSEAALRFSIELQDSSPEQTDKVVLNDCALADVIDKHDRRIVMLIPPGKRCSFDALDGASDLTPHTKALPQRIQAFCRRRLSEFRDNYLSKNALILLTAKSLQRHFQSVGQPQLHSR